MKITSLSQRSCFKFGVIVVAGLLGSLITNTSFVGHMAIAQTPPSPPGEETVDADNSPDLPPPPPADVPYSEDSFDGSAPPAPNNSGPVRAGGAKAKPQQAAVAGSPDKKVPPGKELVSIDFPEPTELKDIIKAVGQWMGKNFILSKTTSAKVSIISPQLVTKEEAYQAFLSALNVAGFTTVETGKFVKIVPTNIAPGANIKTFYGSSWAPATDETITQIIPLTYLTAAELANNIKSILRLTSNISAFPTTNSLIVTDTGHKVRRLLELIRILDIKGNQPQFVMEPLRNTDAADIAKKIQDLFSARGGGGSPYLQKTIVDQRTNSLILVGPSKGLDDVVRIIRRLDKAGDDQGSQAQIHIRPLEYADSEKLAATLQSLAQGSKSGNTSTRRTNSNFPMSGSGIPGAATNVVAELGDVKITADKSTNSLIIQGSKSAYQGLESIIQTLDKRRDQVYIEVDVLDINIGNDLNIGMSALAGASIANKKFVMPFTWNAAGVAPLAIKGTDAAAAGLAGLGSLAQQNAVLGILGTKGIEIGGFKVSPGALIFALKTDSNSNVLQTPNLLTADNEDAMFNATERNYYQDTTLDATGKAAGTKWQNTDATLELTIKPQISQSDYVNLDINIQADRFDQRVSAEAPPNRNSRKTKTKVVVMNQQTIVLSGLVRDTEVETKSKVPLLGDIPVLGWLFRNTKREKSKTSLTIFITPYIVRDSSDLAKIYDKKVRDRDEFLKVFYGDAYKNMPIFSRMPNLDKGKVPEPRRTPVPVPTATPAPQATGGEKNGAGMPSEDPDPVVVPGGGSSGAGSAPSYGGSDMGSGGSYDPNSMPSQPPPPPPPNLPQSNSPDMN